MTMLSRAPLTPVALAFALVAVIPRAEAQGTRSDSAAILDAGRQFSAAYVRGDVAALTALYTADAVIFPERSDAITGQEAIKRFIDGKHAYDHGTYEIAGERDGKAWGPFSGKYLVVWRREPAGWRIQLDMWNSGPKSGSP
jgi:ketosteroid isomerase-like protein